jgi:hypothetical protein
MKAIFFLVGIVALLVTVLFVYVYKKYLKDKAKEERRKEARRLENLGEIIINVLGTLSENENLSPVELVFGYRLNPWDDGGLMILAEGILFSGSCCIEIKIPYETNQYIVESVGDDPYQNFTDKTQEGDVSEKGLVDVIQHHLGFSVIERKEYQAVKIKDENEELMIDPLDWFEINRIN